MSKHRIIDFHTHLGDIFHENQNIVFKKPGSVKHPDCFDPFKDLEEFKSTGCFLQFQIEKLRNGSCPSDRRPRSAARL